MSGFVADSQGHTTSGPTITWREYEGLLARIRELEAQAARGAAVVEAALEIYPDLANAPVIAAALAAREAE